MVPLFGAVPGGPELLIILLVLVLLFGIPLVLLLGGGVLGVKLFADSGNEDGRVDELERELSETKAELRELRDQRDGDSGATGSGDAGPDATDRSDRTDGRDPDDQTESRSP
ncbi:hypothetical protein [Halorarum halobium]|uniref:hypothetical protein n=1 Tax=Halorarum halobium TaxID=3075121 RepID=UPI0028B03C0A|nr:hypothetical protein [Halobaculum sp. XH14]